MGSVDMHSSAHTNGNPPRIGVVKMLPTVKTDRCIGALALPPSFPLHDEIRFLRRGAGVDNAAAAAKARISNPKEVMASARFIGE
jgi:hypothetical protein